MAVGKTTLTFSANVNVLSVSATLWPAGTKQNGNLAESTFTETVNVNVVLPAPFLTS
jgi:hypothetical protein